MMRNPDFCAVSVALLAAVPGLVRADYNPIPLTPASYNADIVVERTAPPPLPAGCTASMDGGNNNTGNTWYETGFNTAAPTTGIPLAGTTLVHENDAAKSYLLPPSYKAPNAVFISNQVTTGTMSLTVPGNFTNLSFLSSSGGGACVINYTVSHADASTETGTFTSGDWFNGASQAWTANGRVQVDGGTAFNNVSAGNPRLYSQDIVVSDASPVTKIDFTYVSGGRCSLFGVSGGSALGVWTPLAVTGFTRDVVLMTGESEAAALTTVTTVSMDGGTANTGNTWYERGYYPQAPNTGLPAPGATITSTALPDHHYLMPASYSAPNAIYVDSISPNATITLATPANYSALSFLNATANGAVTVQCTMHYQDNTSEVQTFTAKDWFNGTPFAYNSAGRVNLNNRSMNNYFNGVNPRLYEAEFFLNNTVSPIVSVDLQFLSGGATARVAILAVSAAAGAVKPIFSAHPQPVNLIEGTPASFAATLSGGTAPITLRWQKNINGTFTNLSDTPTITGTATDTLNINPTGVADAGVYRLTATNVAGTSTTLTAALTVLSSLPDVTSPGDLVTAYGGGFPGGEAPLNAIDNVTQKYLNMGSGPNAGAPPFAGPAGFTVTPAVGASVVSGLRLYTANDVVGRDPVDYTLEGSNDDGLTYTVISTGPLALPDGRNAGGTVPLAPLTQFLQQILFSNTAAFTSYRLSFMNVKDAAAVNSMQIAEVELLGSFTPSLTIGPGTSPGEIEIRTNRPGMLQSATVLSGVPDPVWSDLQPIDPVTPYLFTPATNEPRRFFRADTSR